MELLARPSLDRAPKDHIYIRILQTMISGIPLALEPASELFTLILSYAILYFTIACHTNDTRPYSTRRMLILLCGPF